MYNFFIERVKEHLHVVLAMSPIGASFRNRLRMFPSLINCCTIDWFQASCSGCMRILQYPILHCRPGPTMLLKWWPTSFWRMWT